MSSIGRVIPLGRLTPERNVLRKLLIIIGVTAYPMWFHSPVLFSKSTSHVGLVGNDINLSIREAQALSRMKWPWSTSTFFNYPKSGNFWRIEHLTDIPQKAFYWLCTRLLEPTPTVNIYHLIGPLLTGCLAYILCRRLGLPATLAVISALICQSLPAIHQLTLTGVAANQNAIFPLLAIVVLNLEKPLNVNRDLRTAALLLFGAFATSVYQANYTAVVLLIWLLYRRRDFYQVALQNRERLLKLWFPSILIMISVLGILAWKLLGLTVSESGQPYGIYSISEVSKDPYTLRGFVHPDPFHVLFPSGFSEPEGYSQQYTGIIICSIAALSLIPAVFRNLPVRLRFVTISALVLIWMSLGSISIGGATLPAARNVLRFVMIGNRRFAIAGFIAQVLIVVVFVFLVHQFASRIPRRRFGYFLMMVIVLLAVVDLNPLSRRNFYTYGDRFDEIRSVLDSDSDSGIYVAPGTIRDVDLYVLNAPVYKDYSAVIASAVQGSDVLADHLLDHSTQFVLALVDDDGRAYFQGYIQNAVRGKYFLPTGRFEKVADDVSLENRTDDGTIERRWVIRLLKVVGPAALSSNDYVLAQYVSTPILEVVNPDLERSTLNEEWSTAPEISLTFEALPSEIVYEIPPPITFVASFIAPLGSTAPLEIVLSSAVEAQKVTVGPLPVKVKIRARMYERLTISTNSPCVFGSDPRLGVLLGRQICFGISEFAVLQSIS